jgi:putative sigma-54 modulation protein
MRVTVTFRHIDATEALRQYAETKVRRVASKYFRRPIEGHVVLGVTKHRHGAEITVAADRSTVNARGETGDLYSAIDLAVDKIERQAKKRKTKRHGHKAHKAVSAPRLASARRPEPPLAAEDPPRSVVIRTERMPAKPMTVDEAVLQLDVSAREFLMFRNASTEMLNVVYRRKDGNYGLIEPHVRQR